MVSAMEAIAKMIVEAIAKKFTTKANTV